MNKEEKKINYLIDKELPKSNLSFNDFSSKISIKKNNNQNKNKLLKKFLITFSISLCSLFIIIPSICVIYFSNLRYSGTSQINNISNADFGFGKYGFKNSSGMPIDDLNCDYNDFIIVQKGKINNDDIQINDVHFAFYGKFENYSICNVFYVNQHKIELIFVGKEHKYESSLEYSKERDSYTLSFEPKYEYIVIFAI
ncbi:MAG TPA: hypothetical protein DDW20_01725 [Firmicutes bacterium]|nr:hypothetical protein [Bacillota bacterium]